MKIRVLQSTIKEVRQDMYKKDYMHFEMKHGESLDDFFALFHKILSNLRAIDVTITNVENAHQILGALDMSIWEMKVTSIRESTVMGTLTLDVLYSKLKTHELDILVRKNNSKWIALTSQSSKMNWHSSLLALLKLCRMWNQGREGILVLKDVLSVVRSIISVRSAQSF
jgi:hypothetical protein